MSLTSTMSALSSSSVKLCAAADNALKPDFLEMQAALDLVKPAYFQAVRLALWQVDRSVDYYQLREYAPDPNMRADDVATLAASAGTTEASLVSTITSWSGAAEVFPPNREPPFRVSVMLNARDQAALIKGKLLISISLAQRPKAYPRAIRVFADSVRLSIDRLVNPRGFLTHMGTSRFAVDATETVEFLLPPSAIPVSSSNISLGSPPPSTQAALSPDKDYIGLSPFSDWLVEITNPPASWHTSPPKFVNFDFRGTMRTSLS